ncbi:class I SAM-dependent methyltransferase [Phenylobacterium sp.]|jgi:hypothetical protein|uniref:class I SAM-dependent methyltransferase n=1 Tax=Phenylobacterium sp. TaxID=1871053 RepID=UPI002F3FA5A3
MNDTIQTRLNDTADPNSLSTKFRKKRDEKLRKLISEIASKKSATRILDLGGSVEYWKRVGTDYLRTTGVKVTILNHIESELKSSGEDPDIFEDVVADACDLSEFKDGEFDLVHSNSVIEHVGNWGRVEKFAAETRRVGNSYYVQTPNFWFPIDPHYYKAPLIHFMPRPIQAKILESFSVCTAGRADSLGSALSILDGTCLLDRRQMNLLFPEASLEREIFMGLTKSLIAIHNP